MSLMRLTLLAGAIVLAGGVAVTAYAHDHDKSAGHRFESRDANHDGFIDKSEAAASGRLSEHFDDFDANHDSKLTADEVKSGRHAAWAGKREGFIKARLAEADSNGDGRMSWDEASVRATAKAKERFDSLDTNRDGYIDETEMTNGHGHGHHHRHHDPMDDAATK